MTCLWPLFLTKEKERGGGGKDKSAFIDHRLSPTADGHGVQLGDHGQFVGGGEEEAVGLAPDIVHRATVCQMKALIEYFDSLNLDFLCQSK